MQINPTSTRGLIPPEVMRDSLEDMNTHEIFLIGLVALAVVAVVARQLHARPVRQDYRRPMIMGAAGVALVGSELLRGMAVTGLDVLSIGLGLLLACAVAWPLARTRRVFVRDGRLMCRGTWGTVVVWVGFLALRLAETTFVPVLFGRGLHAMTPLAGYTSLLVVAIALGLETRFTLRRPDVRDARLGAAGQAEVERERVSVR